MKAAGPLWIENIFDTEFVSNMLESVEDCNVDKRCGRLLSIVKEEVNMPPTYFSVDRIAERLKVTPPAISDIISRFKDSGFVAARTSLKLTGFKTNAGHDEVLDVLRGIIA